MRVPRQSSPPPVTRLLWSRLIWRHWRKEWKLTAVLLLIVSLGVAVFLAIRLANKAAVSGFSLFTESISGESDFVVRPAAGELPGTVLLEIRELRGNDPVDVFPVVEQGAALLTARDTLIKLVGVDLIALQNAASRALGSAASNPARDGERVGVGDSTVGFAGEAFAKRFGLEVGDRILLAVNDQEVTLELAGVLQQRPDLPAVPDNLILMDLPALQEIADRSEELTRIEFRIAEGVLEEEVRSRFSGSLEKWAIQRGFIFETPENRKDSVTLMSAAFRMNLAILSGLALLVGIYLIMQAMEAAVVKRRAEMAVLRSLGVMPLEIRKVWLFEGVILGVVGSVFGILLGFGLSKLLVGGISRTVNTLYYETTSKATELTMGEVFFCLAFGISASLMAVIVPARDAASTPPAQLMRQGGIGGGLALLRNRWFGLVLLGSAYVCTILPPLILKGSVVFPLGGYLASVLTVLGGSIFIGVIFRPVASFLKCAVARGSAMRRYAASQLGRPAGRHRLTAAGLGVAIGMSAAMGILVASFETTLTGWIRQLLKADLYVSAAGAQSVSNVNVISKDTWQVLSNLEGIEGADRLRRYRVSHEGFDIFVGGSEYNENSERRLQLIWLDPPIDKSAAALRKRADGAFRGWINEAFERRFELGRGDRVDLATPAGNQTILIDGVYADYGSENGMILIAREHTSRWFGDESVSDLALYAKPGADVDGLLDQIQETFPLLRARTNATLREESIRIFRQTFAVTYALEAIAVLIAVSGLGLALAGLMLERRNELGVLKSLGATRQEIAQSAMWEGVGIALVGFMGGIAMSFALGWILIEVINPQSFGWTLVYRVPWISFLLLGVLTVATAALVAWVVGYRNAVLKSDREG